MTGYDPYSYGQIKLGDQGDKSGDSPDDLLFDDAGPVPGAVSPASGDSEWELPEAGPPAMRAAPPQHMGAQHGFDDELVGESDPPRDDDYAPAPALSDPTSMDLDDGPPAAAGAPAQRRERSPEAAPVAPAYRTARKPKRGQATRPLARKETRRPIRVFGTIVPPLVFAGGGGATAWFYIMEHNIVMAAIVGATALVGTAFTRILLK